MESSTQKLGFCWISKTTWRSDSSDIRKNPSLDGSGIGTDEEDTTDTEETETLTCPD